jgi:hypothetical protein
MQTNCFCRSRFRSWKKAGAVKEGQLLGKGLTVQRGTGLYRGGGNLLNVAAREEGIAFAEQQFDTVVTTYTSTVITITCTATHRNVAHAKKDQARTGLLDLLDHGIDRYTLGNMFALGEIRVPTMHLCDRCCCRS